VVAALLRLRQQGALRAWPVRDQVAAVSVGILGSRTLLDLDYEEDSRVAVDLNLVGTATRGIVEVQAAAERETFSRRALEELLDLGERGLERAFTAQRQVLERRLADAGLARIAGSGS
jgi:ribonuclease PH